MKLNKSLNNGKGHPPTAKGFNQAYAEMIQQRQMIVVRLRTAKFLTHEEIPRAMYQLWLKEQKQPEEKRSGFPYINPSNEKPWSLRTIKNDLANAKAGWIARRDEDFDIQAADLWEQIEAQKRESTSNVPADKLPGIINGLIRTQIMMLGNKNEESFPKKLIFKWFNNFENLAGVEFNTEQDILARVLKVWRMSIMSDTMKQIEEPQ